RDRRYFDRVGNCPDADRLRHCGVPAGTARGARRSFGRAALRVASMSDLEPPDIAQESTRRQDRRSWLKEVGAAGAGALIVGPAASQPATTGTILPRTSTTGVFIPPRGRGFMKFSFDCPEPSVAFEGFEFSFRVFTQENTYSLSADHLAVRASDNGLEIRGDELTWAGGQQRASGRVIARLTRRGDAVECEADVEME